MSGRVWVRVVAGAVLAVGLSSGQARAGRMMFGTDESIHVIQPTNEPGVNLCYKTSMYFLGAGCYVSDDGYVLQKVGESKTYHPLDPDLIRSLQAEGSLPTPMPPYSLSIFDYLFGYSNWILLGIFGGIPAIKWALERSRASRSLGPESRSRATA